MKTQDSRPANVLEYARPEKQCFLTDTSIIAIVGCLISFVSGSLFSCLCGHQDWMALPGNLLATRLVIWSLARRAGWGDRVLRIVAIAFTAMMLIHNIHNLLWSGHEPWLR